MDIRVTCYLPSMNRVEDTTAIVGPMTLRPARWSCSRHVEAYSSCRGLFAAWT
ncbi:hypothetical protein BC943DRAFT_315072 [Umbelopsis sp. AD052]|nr:hypothetical protein BC943DRAFT_315072 [Umbelopsis sp. AD052]